MPVPLMPMPLAMTLPDPVGRPVIALLLMAVTTPAAVVVVLSVTLIVALVIVARSGRGRRNQKRCRRPWSH